MKKRILSLLLCLVLCLSLISMSAFAQELPSMQNVSISADGVLSWDAVPGAAKYHVGVGSGGGWVTETSDDLNSHCASLGFDTGTYSVNLYAADSANNQITEIWTGTFHYVSTQEKLAEPTNLRFEGSTCKWDAVPHATSYIVALMDEEGHALASQITSSTQYAFTLEAGKSYKFMVVASAAGYVTSEATSSLYTFGTGGLSMQNVSISADGVLSWDAVSGAAKYHVGVGSGGGWVAETSDDLNSHCASLGFDTGTYSVNLYAADSANNQITEIWTGTFHYVSTQPTLAVPTNLRFEGSTCKWDAVPHATSYVVALMDEEGHALAGQITSSTQYAFTLAVGKSYKFMVVASAAGYVRSEATSSLYTYNGEFLGIWIGDKPVTSVNRYDVLHDGGSVQFLPDGSAYGCGGKTLVLNNLNLTNPIYHTNADGHRYMLTIADDINVVLIGENIIHPPKNGKIFWEDDNGSLDGVYIGRNMYVRFFGDGSLDVSVSRNNSAFFSDNSTVMLEDNVTMRLSGKYGFNSYSEIEVPWLALYDNSKLYAYGLRDYNNKDGLAIHCPEIKLRDNAYLYAEYEWNEQAVYTWDSDYKAAWANTVLNIRGIRNQIGMVNTEWETLESINTGTEDDEGKFRALEIQAGKPSVLFGDANGDGTVDSKDLSLLRKYMAAYDYTTGTSTVTVKAGADANGDGTIDSKDLSLLRKYMAAYDYTSGTSTVVLGPSK